MKWMAAQEATKPQPNASHHAVLFDRLAHVFRAGRVEAAGGWQQGGDPSLIETQNSSYEFLHCWTSLSTSRLMSACGASRIALRGLNTMAHLLSSCHNCRRMVSRIRRFMRLRTTALPNARVTVKPTFGPSCCSGIARQKAAKEAQLNREPRSYTVRKSLERRIRKFLGNRKLRAEEILLGVSNCALVADCKLVTAFGTAAGENSASILGLHAFPETMSFGSLAIVRLKGTFRHCA